MFDAKEIKSIIINRGADLCGIAPVERFGKAPKGFHPKDIYEKCKSVIVFANSLPIESVNSQSCIPYTFVNKMITEKVDKLTFDLCAYLEKSGINVVPIPSDDPYEYWIEEDTYGRAILSLRHAGYLAGLGVLGRNTLLINEKFGNMIQLGALLTDLKLTGDPMATYQICGETCSICLESCSVEALDGETVDQKLCRPLSTYHSPKGYVLKKCNDCRISCPYFKGIN
jgi:epoxyqueuosine reductase QueG